MFSRLMFILASVSILVLSGAIWVMLDSPVRSLVISGELSALERDEVRAALSSKNYGGVLSTDLHEVSARLDNLPWAKGVNVRRIWPDKIEVSLKRAGPVARWGDEQYVSAYGDLLSLPDEYPTLPRFDVAHSTPYEAMEVYRLLNQIGGREALTIAALYQNSQGEWGLRFSNGPEVLLGASDLNQRMHRYLLVYRQVLESADRPAEYVDARYANGIAVRFAEQNETEPLLVADRRGQSQVLGNN